MTFLHAQTKPLQKITFEDVLHFPHKYIGYNFVYSDFQFYGISARILNGKDCYELSGFRGNAHFYQGNLDFYTSQAVAEFINKHRSKNDTWRQTPPCRVYFTVYKLRGVDNIFTYDKCYAWITKVEFYSNGRKRRR